MEGSARVGVINEPDVQLLAASKGFFFVFFLSDETREAGTEWPRPRLLLCGLGTAEQGSTGQWRLYEM